MHVGKVDRKIFSIGVIVLNLKNGNNRIYFSRHCKTNRHSIKNKDKKDLGDACGERSKLLCVDDDYIFVEPGKMGAIGSSHHHFLSITLNSMEARRFFLIYRSILNTDSFLFDPFSFQYAFSSCHWSGTWCGTLTIFQAVGVERLPPKPFWPWAVPSSFATEATAWSLLLAESLRGWLCSTPLTVMVRAANVKQTVVPISAG